MILVITLESLTLRKPILLYTRMYAYSAYYMSSMKALYFMLTNIYETILIKSHGCFKAYYLRIKNR